MNKASMYATNEQQIKIKRKKTKDKELKRSKKKI